MKVLLLAEDNARAGINHVSVLYLEKAYGKEDRKLILEIIRYFSIKRRQQDVRCLLRYRYEWGAIKLTTTAN